MRASDLHFPARALLLSLAAYSILQVFFLGLAPIAGSTEAREAQVIDTIVRDGEWVLPLRNGIVPSKPPLFHWIGATISLALGEVNELTVRLPTHLAAIGILFLTGLVGFRVARLGQTVEGELHAERVALIAPAILSLTYGFHQLACQAMVDMTFALCMWGALAALLCSAPEVWKRQQQISTRSRSLFWICLAGAVLARGPVGLILPLAIAGTIGLFLSGFKRTVREALRPSLGWLAFILPVAWYVAAYQVGGEAFLARQLFFENIQRFVGGEKINTEAWWFYIPSLLRTTAPWGALVLVGVIVYIRKSRSFAFLGGFRAWAVAPSLALIAGITIFSISSGKRHSYMLPLYPFIAIQSALLFSMLLERRPLGLREKVWRIADRTESVLGALVVATVVAIGTTHLVDWGRHPLEDILKFACAPLTISISIAALATLATLALTKAKGQRLPYVRVWGLLLLLMTISVSAGNVLKGTYKSWPLITEQLLLTVQPHERIVVIKDSFDEYFDPIFFYAHRPIAIASSDEQSQPCQVHSVYVARRSWLESNWASLNGFPRRVATLRSLRKTFGGDTSGEDIEVFRCAPSDSHGAPLGAELSDAAFTW